jgi:hypothetical protein
VENKRLYIKPEIIKVEIDMSISLVMKSKPPKNPVPRPRGAGSSGTDSPFASPFGDKPFD